MRWLSSTLCDCCKVACSTVLFKGQARNSHSKNQASNTPSSPRIPQVAYDHSIYHQATNPSLNAAKRSFDAHNGQHYLKTSIQTCFLKHGVEKTFSVCLIHRHFDLELDERNIEEGDQATASKKLKGMSPCSWLFHEGKVFPYEFTRDSISILLSQDFVDELGEILVVNDLCAVLGIQVYRDGVVGVESTERSARVSRTVDYPEDSSEWEKDEGMVQASFAFL